MKRLEAVSGSINFVNFHEISRGLSPLRPSAAEREAARIALARIAYFTAARTTFATETTLSGMAQLRMMTAARDAGFAVNILYFSARDPDICIERIGRRVAEGGHDILPQLVRRRFERSLANLPSYLAEADLWRIYEASGNAPRLALEGHGPRLVFRDDEHIAAGHPALAAIAEATAA